MKRLISLSLVFLLVFEYPVIAQTEMDITGNEDGSKGVSGIKNAKSAQKTPKLKDEDAMLAEESFYQKDFIKAEEIFKTLVAKKDRNFALWNSQLASCYLNEGRKGEAKDALSNAFFLMNNIEAFKGLENKALGLMGEESSKAYKGDPFEKVLNALYLGLLLYDNGDVDNALAAFQSGILADSDVEGSLYKSDFALLYFLAARMESIRGNKSMSDDYYAKGAEAFYLAHPSNWEVVSNEQAYLSILADKQKELDALNTKYKKGHKKIDALKLDISNVSETIQKLTAQRVTNSKNMDVAQYENLINKDSNVLICIELGRSPLKFQVGQYGQFAVFGFKPYRARKLLLVIDNNYQVDEKSILSNNSVLHQAVTRGGRKMDSILKGKAAFKQATAETAYALSQQSSQMVNQANQLASSNPYYDASGAYAAAGIIAIFSMGMAVASSMANPAADVRHWSLLPDQIQIIPLNLSPGKHSINLKILDTNSNECVDLDTNFDIDVKASHNNVFFKRILE